MMFLQLSLNKLYHGKSEIIGFNPFPKYRGAPGVVHSARERDRRPQELWPHGDRPAHQELFAAVKGLAPWFGPSMAINFKLFTF
jgi:hypothetical protein